MRVIKVHVIFIKGGSRVIYFTNKQYYTLWTTTKAVNFGQSRCGVAACRPTRLVVAQPQDRPPTTETSAVHGRGDLTSETKGSQSDKCAAGGKQTRAAVFSARGRSSYHLQGEVTSSGLTGFPENVPHSPSG